MGDIDPAGLIIGGASLLISVVGLVFTVLVYRQTRPSRPWRLEKISDMRWVLYYTGRGHARISHAFVHGDHSGNEVSIRDGSGMIQMTLWSKGSSLPVFLHHPSPGMSFNLLYRRECRFREGRVPTDRETFEGDQRWQVVLS